MHISKYKNGDGRHKNGQNKPLTVIYSSGK